MGGVNGSPLSRPISTGAPADTVAGSGQTPSKDTATAR